MPLPPGTWKANINGIETSVSIGAPNQQGMFTGQLSVGQPNEVPIRGFWDETSQTLTFSVTVAFENAYPYVAVFKAWLFRTPPNPPPGQDVLAMLTGFVQTTVGNTASSTFPVLPTARRNVFGWFAQMTEVL